MNFFEIHVKLKQLGDFFLAGIVSCFSASPGSEIDKSNLWKIFF